MSEDVFDAQAVVIGAGVIGLACAAELARRGVDAIVLEREDKIGAGISSRNSEVIHAGIYYPTGGRKHLNCIEGRRKLYAYLERARVDHAKIGKLIVATDAREAAEIEAIYFRALRNGVENLRFLSAAQTQALEPALNVQAAILSGETGIVDSHGYMRALQGEIESAGGAVALSSAVEAVRHDGRRFDILAGGARLRSAILINAAGLDAVRLATAMEVPHAAALPRLTLAKGSYFAYPGRAPFSRLVYPAPVDGGLGVHATLDLGGRMRFGPDVEWLDHDDPAAIDYAVDPRRADQFYAAIRKYWPALPDGALAPDYAGCRPKLSARGEPAADFRIDGPALHGVAGLVHLFGIESPGLTSSLAIAEEAVRQALGEAPPAPAPGRAAVIFDRDGTLNHDDGYTHRPEDLRWTDGAIDAIRAVNAAGALAIVATNQSGLGRGFYDEAAMQAFHAAMQRDLAAAGARIDAFYHSPYIAGAASAAFDYADHPDRKPKPGMLLRAIADHRLDPARTVMIGDRSDDIDAAKAAGVRGVRHQGGDLLDALTPALSALRRDV
ncbi:MAG: FAD-dependent oxidoreductase [Hyphomonadaceae bacterium]|nr:FAD-dependent oxidoreductase [Hyphomonadaceae bacterium]